MTQLARMAGVAIAAITISVSGSTSAFTVTHLVPPASEVLLAAGDIATCTNDFDEATAKLLDANSAGTIALLGDNAYANGSRSDYANCYHPTWGRHFDRTKPAAGNHEYQTAGAAGYYAYFGSKAGDPEKGYYSYDLGAWHVIVLNSNIAHDAGSVQLQWLRSDLQANTGKACTLAYWHHPHFSSGVHGNGLTVGAIWDTLYAYDADVILNGHEHNYERFAPQTPAGVADDARGIRAFIVGTGGTYLRTLGTRRANSRIFNSTTHGLLKLTLSQNSYRWQFLPTPGETFTDSGTGNCH